MTTPGLPAFLSSPYLAPRSGVPTDPVAPSAVYPGTRSWIGGVLARAIAKGMTAANAQVRRAAVQDSMPRTTAVSQAIAAGAANAAAARVRAGGGY